MSKLRRHRKPNIPIHSGVRIEANGGPVAASPMEKQRFGMVAIGNVEIITLPLAQPDYRCAECKASWSRETATIALSSNKERQIVRLSGFWECCNKLFRWGDAD